MSSPSGSPTVGGRIDEAVSNRHRRRLRRVGWEHALDASTPAFSQGTAPLRGGNALRSAAPGPAGDLLSGAVKQANKVGADDRFLALALGLIGTMITATTAMGQLERGLNRIYGVERDRPVLAKYRMAFLLAISAGAVIATSFVLLAFGRQFGTPGDLGPRASPAALPEPTRFTPAVHEVDSQYESDSQQAKRPAQLVRVEGGKARRTQTHTTSSPHPPSCCRRIDCGARRGRGIGRAVSRALDRRTQVGLGSFRTNRGSRILATQLPVKGRLT